MYITDIDLIAEKLKANASYSISEIISEMIAEHEKTEAYQQAVTADKYYDGKHDILEKNFQESYVYMNDDEAGGIDATVGQRSELIINRNNSNHHNVHNFFAQLVDQAVDYIAGNPVAVSVEGAGTDPKNKSPEKLFEDQLTKQTTDEKFQDFIAESVAEASIKGRCYWHPYYDRDGMLRWCIFPLEEIIVIRDAEYQDTIVEFIRYYNIKKVKSGAETTVRRVEWWRADSVDYYLENDSGVFEAERLDQPHWKEITSTGTDEPVIEGDSWGEVPLIEVKSNIRGQSLLPRIKGLQDAYNLLSSKLANDEIDMVALYWIIQGYGGEAAGMVRKKLELNKAVTIDDPEGKVSAEQINLQTGDRLLLQEALKRDIFTLGEGMIPDMERSGNINTTELKMRYDRLRKKSKRMCRSMKVGFKSLFSFMARDIGAGVDPAAAVVSFHFDEVVNDNDLIDNILKLRGFVPDSILMKLVPYVDDPNQAYIEMEEQRVVEEKRRADAFQQYPRGPRVDNRIVAGRNATGDGDA